MTILKCRHKARIGWYSLAFLCILSDACVLVSMLFRVWHSHSYTHIAMSKSHAFVYITYTRIERYVCITSVFCHQENNKMLKLHNAQLHQWHLGGGECFHIVLAKDAIGNKDTTTEGNVDKSRIYITHQIEKKEDGPCCRSYRHWGRWSLFVCVYTLVWWRNQPLISHWK